jgi:two-component system sensor histidine kinase RegB
MALSHVLEDAVAPHRDFGISIRIDKAGEAPEPVAGRNPGLLYGLGNIVENAVDFAKTEVAIRAEWTADEVKVAIEDDGSGFAADVLDQLGEPYVTTRRAGRQPAPEHGGLGLGIFIAKTLLERSGAKLHLANRRPPLTGASVTVVWPRSAFESAAPQALSKRESSADKSLIGGA